MRKCAPARTRRTLYVIAGVALPLPAVRHAEVSMLMFKRTQLYIGFALAALAEIIVRAVAR